ncbi:phenylalanine--tRNA ligase subunit beta [Candidatus Saccharibacteria bacterium]|nr:phenylalanine--tRNA ligase subunit beta [Candidatus Saccharibacteria bacterium]|tara:strand:+ start:3512 stop:6001 length:2490 start_codon:yes stop_codon:yes gene_type:complete
MIISVNWLKKFTDIDLPVQELAELIGQRLVEIEEVIPLTDKYRDVRIVKVVSCSPVEDSDHLHLTKVDDGGVVEGVDRDENGYVQVVCGAPNVREGMFAAWLPPKTVVPETYGTAEPFTLGARQLRGHMSNGMLASAKELALYDDHAGIIEIDQPVEPGASFADVFELNDYLLDIENKSLTHRPDAFGVIGFAREVAGIQGKAFRTPEWLSHSAPVETVEQSSDAAPRVVIEDPILSDRFTGMVFEGASEAAQSPLWMQTYLARSGMRPINAIVDITNYLMLLTGQPMHAYDYDKLLEVSGGVNEVRVRAARPGENLKILDGRELELSPDDTVIAAGEVAVGLAGAMGGAATEIDANTRRIFLECATFNLFKLRAVQMRHGIFSEAITRLTKGVPAPLAQPVLLQAAALLAEYTGAHATSSIVEDYPGQSGESQVVTDVQRINDVLGTALSEDDVKRTLEAVEFTVEIVDGQVVVGVPYWRHDISIPEDVIEEIGRLRGFDSIDVTLPLRRIRAVEPSAFDQLRTKLRRQLVRAGANEVLTYSFVHGDLMQKAGQKREEAYRITNSISPDLQYYRQSLTPSLLAAIHPNVKAGYDEYAIFEFNKFHTKRHGLNEEEVPKELDSLALVVTRQKKQASAAFYSAKQYLQYLADSMGIELFYEPLEADSDYPVTQPFEPKRSARVWDRTKTVRIGVVGEYRRAVAKAFKLPDHTAGFEVSPRALHQLAEEASVAYRPMSRYPSVERDVCFQVSVETTYQQLADAMTVSLSNAPFEVSFAPLDIFQPSSGNKKNITMTFTMFSYDRTLTGEEVSAYMESVVKGVLNQVEGEVV